MLQPYQLHTVAPLLPYGTISTVLATFGQRTASIVRTVVFMCPGEAFALLLSANR